MRVKAIHKMYYNRQDRLPGEVYEMDNREESEARILSALGKIEILAEQPVFTPTKVTTRALVAEQPETKIQEEEKPTVTPMTTETASDLTPSAPRRYRRRDMRSET